MVRCATAFTCPHGFTPWPDTYCDGIFCDDTRAPRAIFERFVAEWGVTGWFYGRGCLISTFKRVKNIGIRQEV